MIIVAISFYGSFLNARKKKACFIMWITSGLLWGLVDLVEGKFWRLTLDMVQVSFSIYGFLKWGQKNIVETNLKH